MDPEERADALAVRAGRHSLGDLEVVLEVPRAGVDDTEDDKVLRLDVVDVGLVGDADTAAGSVVDVVGVDSSGGLARAREVGVRVLDVATTRRSDRVKARSCTRTHPSEDGHQDV